MSGDIRRQY